MFLACCLTGFRGFHIARGGAHADGCASFYRESIFDLIESVPLKYCRNGVAVLDRMNVAFLMLLRCKRPASVSDRRDSEEVGDTTKRNASDVVLVANTHLLYNPKRGDVKLAQVITGNSKLFCSLYKLGGKKVAACACVRACVCILV